MWHCLITVALKLYWISPCFEKGNALKKERERKRFWHFNFFFFTLITFICTNCKGRNLLSVAQGKEGKMVCSFIHLAHYLQKVKNVDSQMNCNTLRAWLFWASIWIGSGAVQLHSSPVVWPLCPSPSRSTSQITCQLSRSTEKGCLSRKWGRRRWDGRSGTQQWAAHLSWHTMFHTIKPWKNLWRSWQLPVAHVAPAHPHATAFTAAGTFRKSWVGPAWTGIVLLLFNHTHMHTHTHTHTHTPPDPSISIFYVSVFTYIFTSDTSFIFYSFSRMFSQTLNGLRAG